MSLEALFRKRRKSVRECGVRGTACVEPACSQVHGPFYLVRPKPLGRVGERAVSVKPLPQMCRQGGVTVAVGTRCVPLKIVNLLRRTSNSTPGSLEAGRHRRRTVPKGSLGKQPLVGASWFRRWNRFSSFAGLVAHGFALESGPFGFPRHPRPAAAMAPNSSGWCALRYAAFRHR
jgi:hypothetical protein